MSHIASLGTAGVSGRTPVAIAACLAFLLASCAAPMHYSRPVDPMSVLSRDAIAYLRMGRKPLMDFAPALLGSLGTGAPSRYVRSMLEKTEAVAVAILPGEPGASPAAPGSMPRLEAVLMGDYPYRSATFALSQDRQWKKDGRGRALVSSAQGLGLSFPGPGIALATSDGGRVSGKFSTDGTSGAADRSADRGTAIEASIEALIDRLLVPGATVIPARLSALCDSDIVVWAADPFGALAGELLESEAAADIDIPAVGLFLAADRVADGNVPGPAGEAAGAAPASGGEAVYELAIVFIMRNEEDAKTFRPAIRLAWYAFSRSLMPGEAGIASLRFELSGDAVTASGLRVRASSISSALATLAHNAR